MRKHCLAASKHVSRRDAFWCAGGAGDRAVRGEPGARGGAVHQRPAGAHTDEGQLRGPGGHHCDQGHLPALPQPVRHHYMGPRIAFAATWAPGAVKSAGRQRRPAHKGCSASAVLNHGRHATSTATPTVQTRDHALVTLEKTLSASTAYDLECISTTLC